MQEAIPCSQFQFFSYLYEYNFIRYLFICKRNQANASLNENKDSRAGIKKSIVGNWANENSDFLA